MIKIDADKLIVSGFVAGYFGVMGSVLASAIPAIEHIWGYMMLYLFLPLFVFGVIGAVVGNVYYPTAERWGARK